MSDLFRAIYAIALFFLAIGKVVLSFASPFLVAILLVKAQYELALVFFAVFLYVFFSGNSKPRNDSI